MAPEASIDRGRAPFYFARIVTQQNDKTWQYGQTAATLLVAYLFVLQGLAVGLVVGAKSGQGAFGNAICVTARATPSSDKPEGPRPLSHGLDACCVQHCSGLDEGVIGGVAELAAPVSVYASVLTPSRGSGGGLRRDTLPVGARAPPSLTA